MPSFNDLEDAAKQAATAQIRKQESWLRANRKPLITGAVAVLMLLAVIHFL